MSDINVTLTTPDVITSTLDVAENIVVSIAADTPISITIDSGVGATGAGVPVGGTVGQVLSKVDGTDFNTTWSDVGAGGNHAALSNLAYATSGHTGFEPAKGVDDNYVTDAEKTKLSTIPAGSDREVQFNNAGNLSGSSEFRFDVTEKAVIIGDATLLPDSKLAIRDNVNSYAQVSFQNTNSGTDASTDWIALSNDGDDDSYYGDFGINSSTYNVVDYSLYKAHDVYLLSIGGDLILNTDQDAIIFGVGGTTSVDKIGEVNVDGIDLETGKDYSINGESITIPEIECGGSGLVSGGALTQTAANVYTLASGVGYVAVNGTTRNRVTWSTQTGLSPIGDGANYIRINSSGVLDVTLDPNYDITQYVEVGYVFAGGGGTFILEIVQTPSYVANFPTLSNNFARRGIRALVSEDLGISEQANPNELYLSAAAGTYFAVNKDYDLSLSTTFTRVYNTSNMGWIPYTTPPANKILNTVWNDVTQPAASALVTMTDTYWKTDIVFRVPSGNCYIVVGQAEYATEQEAKDSPLATLPTGLINVAILLAKITMQKNTASVASGITDIRPYLPRVFGFGSAAAGAVQDHGSLTGLSDDDHTQYYNETRGDARYAPIAKGVTNGDTHDHSGGDGAQIVYSTLGSIPLTFAPTSHDNTAHSVTFVETGDSRLSDARTPLNHASSHITGGGDIISDAVAGVSSGLMSGSDKTKLDGIAAGAEVNVNADWNSVSGDSQILNKPSTFAPSAHASSHLSAGGDAIKLDDLAAPDDNTDLDSTIIRHGLLPKLGGGTTNFLRADGTWNSPTAGSDTNTRLFTFVLHRGENAITGTNKTNVLTVDKAYTINKCYAYAKTAPTGAALIFDINLNGTTIWSTQANRIQIAAGANSGTQTSFNSTALVEGDLLTIDIDQIGSTVAGSDITVTLRGDI